MRYVETNENNEKYYSVNCDKEKLKEILEKLKEYSYTTIVHGQVSGESLTKWPTTEKNIKKRVTAFFNKTNSKVGATLLPESIILHTENDSNYITYDYTYEKLPDLYYQIGLIVNNDTRNIIDYEQLGFERILNYENSNELTKHDSIDNEKEYNYKGLNELYKETLACFSFNLYAVKEYLDKPEQVDVLKLKLKK